MDGNKYTGKALYCHYQVHVVLLSWFFFYYTHTVTGIYGICNVGHYNQIVMFWKWSKDCALNSLCCRSNLAFTRDYTHIIDVKMRGGGMGISCPPSFYTKYRHSIFFVGIAPPPDFLLTSDINGCYYLRSHIYIISS